MGSNMATFAKDPKRTVRAAFIDNMDQSVKETRSCEW